MDDDNFQIDTVNIEDLMSENGDDYEESKKEKKSSKKFLYWALLIIALALIQLIPIGSEKINLLSVLVKSILYIALMYAIQPQFSVA